MYIESATVETSPHLFNNKIELVLTGASDADCQNLADIFKDTRHLGFIKLHSPKNWYSEEVLGIHNEKENKTMNKETKTLTAMELCRIEREAYDKGYARGREIGIVEMKARYGFPWDYRALKIKKVIFNDPATIVFWADGTKTVAKAHGDDKFNKEVGLTVCIAKKALCNRSNFDKVFEKWIK